MDMREDEEWTRQNKSLPVHRLVDTSENQKIRNSENSKSENHRNRDKCRQTSERFFRARSLKFTILWLDIDEET